MRSSALISSDLHQISVTDCTNGGQLTIGRRGVLLSVLGNDLVGTEVTADLDGSLSKKLKGRTPFFEFESKDLDKNHLCVSYQDQSNTLYVIGIDDLIITFATPTSISSEKIKGTAVKLKEKTNDGLIAKHVVLVRLEGRTGKKQKLSFYLIDTSE